jgi:hypothetical protein
VKEEGGRSTHRGWPDHPLLKRKKKKKNVKEEGWHRGWFDHPLRPLGWLGHHQIGRSGGGPTKGVAPVKEEGWHPLRGWSNHPLCHPSSFTFFFFFFFSLTGGGPATPYGWIGHPSSFTFFFLNLDLII